MNNIDLTNRNAIVTGGVLLALRAAGLDAGAARAQLMQSTAAFTGQP